MSVFIFINLYMCHFSEWRKCHSPKAKHFERQEIDGTLFINDKKIMPNAIKEKSSSQLARLAVNDSIKPYV